jgi:uncharacterized protein YigA (DUF484 family)
LLVVASPDDAATALFRDLATWDSDLSAASEHGEMGGPLSTAARDHPAQVAYLALAGSMHRSVAQKVPAKTRATRQRASMHGTAPVGPQSVPIGLYVRFAHAIDALHEASDSQVTVSLGTQLVGALRQMAGRYAESIAQAQANRYLWERLQSPVDVVDLDVAVMTAAAAEALEPVGLDFRDVGAPILADLPPLVRTSMTLGVGLRRDGPAQPPGPQDDMPLNQSERPSHLRYGRRGTFGRTFAHLR